MLTGPKLQMPSTLSDIFVFDKESNIISMKPEWATYFNTLQKTVFSATRTGASSERPTSLMTGRYLGMPYYDQTVSSVIFLRSTNPDVWQIGAAATWGGILGVLSTQTDLQTVLNSKAYTSTLAAVATTGQYSSLLGLPVLGTAASTASSTYALAGGGGTGTLTSVALSSAVVGLTVSNSPVTGAAGTFTLLGGPFGTGTVTSVTVSSVIQGLSASGGPVSTAGTISLFSSGIFGNDSLASSGTASSNTVLYGNRVWGTLPAGGTGTLTSVALSSAITGMSVTNSPVTGATGTFTLIGNQWMTSATISNAAYGITVAGSPIGAPSGTITLGGGAVSSIAFSSAVAALTVSGTPVSSATGTITLGGTVGVTSAAVSSAITGITISGSPITGAGTITLSGYPAMTFASSAAQTTISLGLNTFSTATSVSISTGTWLLAAQILVGMNGSTSETHFTARLNDGTNTLSNGQVSIVTTLNSSYASIQLGCIQKYGAPSTVSLQAAGDVTGGFIRGWPWQNSTGSTATMIQATRLV